MAGDTLGIQTLLTSGFFSRKPPGPALTFRSLEGTGGQGALGISGVKGGIPNQLLEKEGNQAMPKPDSPTNMTSTARGTEETYPG